MMKTISRGLLATTLLATVGAKTADACSNETQTNINNVSSWEGVFQAECQDPGKNLVYVGLLYDFVVDGTKFSGPSFVVSASQQSGPFTLVAAIGCRPIGTCNGPEGTQARATLIDSTGRAASGVFAETFPNGQAEYIDFDYSETASPIYGVKVNSF